MDIKIKNNQSKLITQIPVGSLFVKNSKVYVRTNLSTDESTVTCFEIGAAGTLVKFTVDNIVITVNSFTVET